jgi:F0F1-type ATP synthase membrane subunit c/vacuolar-type H+-ATPase subunit K
MKAYAVAIAALPLGLVGLAVGRIFNTTIESIARNPSVQDKLFSVAIIGFAVTEAIALFILLVIFLILYS